MPDTVELFAVSKRSQKRAMNDRHVAASGESPRLENPVNSEAPGNVRRIVWRLCVIATATLIATCTLTWFLLPDAARPILVSQIAPDFAARTYGNSDDQIAGNPRFAQIEFDLSNATVPGKRIKSCGPLRDGIPALTNLVLGFVYVIHPCWTHSV
jgi:hypothetical protein